MIKEYAPAAIKRQVNTKLWNFYCKYTKDAIKNEPVAIKRQVKTKLWKNFASENSILETNSLNLPYRL